MKKTMLIASLVLAISVSAEAGVKSKFKKLGHGLKVGAEYSIAAVFIAVYVYSRGSN